MNKQEDFISKYADKLNDPKRTKILENMITYFTSIQQIKFSSYLKSFFDRFKSSKRHKLLGKSVKKIE